LGVGSKSKIVMKKLPKDDPTRRRPDLGVARKMLEWHPTTSFKIGVVKTIDYFRGIM
jgi:nucleoside-diphosphate-sugar epimerase